MGGKVGRAISHQKKRRRWKAEGLCSGCGREREDKIFAHCKSCRQSNKKSREKIKRFKNKGVYI